MWLALKTVVLVSVVTMLIWLWAEAESLTTMPVTPRLELVATPDRAARFREEGWSGVVRVRLRGSALAIDRAQRVLALPVKIMPGSAALSPEPGTRSMDLAEVLRQDPGLIALGVTIDEVDPPTAYVVVEALVSRTVPVRVEASSLELDGEPVLEPATVMVRLTEADAARLEPPSAATVATALVEPSEVVRLPDGESGTVRVKLQVPKALLGVRGVTLEPAVVGVTLKPRSAELSWFTPEAPVAVVLPAEESGRWDVELFDKSVKGIRVTGPRKTILEMQRRGERLSAYIVLTREDLEARVTSKPVVFTLIPSVFKFEASDAVVRLKITPRG